MNIYKKGEWGEILIPSNLNEYTIETFLRNDWQVPKKLLHQLRMNNGVKLNGDIVSWNSKLNPGEKLQVHLFPQEDYGVKPVFLDVDILYEDDHVLIANKKPGIAVHPNSPNDNNTLANGVAFHLLTEGIETKPRHIHRLDLDTTGAVVFAKHALAGSILDRLLENRAIKRTYLALVHGKVKQKKGVIDQAIGRDRHHKTRRRVSNSGQQARTSYERFAYYAEQDRSLVKLDLETGWIMRESRKNMCKTFPECAK